MREFVCDVIVFGYVWYCVCVTAVCVGMAVGSVGLVDCYHVGVCICCMRLLLWVVFLCAGEWEWKC